MRDRLLTRVWAAGHRRQRGNAVLDAALVLPILLSLTFGTVEYGHYFYWKHTLQGAAREGARAAIIPSATNTEVTTAVSNSMTAAGIPSSRYTLRIRDAADSTDVNVASVMPGQGILVKIQARWGDVGMRPLGLIGANKQVAGQMIMRKE